MVLTLLALVLFIGGQTLGGIVFLVLAFLVSPFGIPAIAEWLVDKLHSAEISLCGISSQADTSGQIVPKLNDGG
ncbi:MAG: CD1845 family protein [Clostridia bacterium]